MSPPFFFPDPYPSFYPVPFPLISPDPSVRFPRFFFNYPFPSDTSTNGPPPAGTGSQGWESNTNLISTLPTVTEVYSNPGVTTPQHTSAASHVVLNQRPVSHSKKLRPKCLICGKEYHAKKALNRHMNDRHSEEEEKCPLPGCPFKCFGRRKRDLYSYSKLSIALALEPAPSSLPRTFLLTRKCGLLCDVVLLPSTRFTARRPSA
ncbi:hypothetical protein BGW80DRAFT_1308438 [Lactifluus volemus]|nr:hypothetical protein BGW80DRAFT_1308438 [Lactifluus volemus]